MTRRPRRPRGRSRAGAGCRARAAGSAPPRRCGRSSAACASATSGAMTTSPSVTGSSGSTTAHGSSQPNDRTSVGPSLPRYCSLSSVISSSVDDRDRELDGVGHVLALEHERREPLERGEVERLRLAMARDADLHPGLPPRSAAGWDTRIARGTCSRACARVHRDDPVDRRRSRPELVELAVGDLRRRRSTRTTALDPRRGRAARARARRPRSRRRA